MTFFIIRNFSIMKGLSMEFEFIDESEIEAVSRGRKSSASPELVKAFATCPKGKAIRLKEFAGDTSNSETYKAHKQNSSATLRSAAKLAGVQVSIHWSPNGVPQVKVSALGSGKTRKA
jgi:hypothetical protein